MKAELQYQSSKQVISFPALWLVITGWLETNYNQVAYFIQIRCEMQKQDAFLFLAMVYRLELVDSFKTVFCSMLLLTKFFGISAFILWDTTTDLVSVVVVLF